MTAVEFLESQIIKFHNWKLNPKYDENCFDEIELDKAIKQAKEMEKQQIIDARVKKPLESEWLEAEQYYNETFNKQIEITNKEYNTLINSLYPKDNSKTFKNK